MAVLYNGGTRISLGATREVIKEVPTEQDLTLMGNELRKAKAYTHEESTAGKIVIFTISGSSIGKYSDPISYTSVGIPDFESYRCTIDNKGYYISVSNDKIILTQDGTDTDWQRYAINGKPVIKNNKLYSSSYNIKSSYMIGDPVNPRFSDFNFDSYNTVINNGKLYKTPSSSVYSLIDDTGTWSEYINYSLALRNGKLCSINYSAGTYTEKLDIVVSPQLLCNSYYASGNKLYYISNKNVYETFSQPIKKVGGSSVQLENDTYYYMGNSDYQLFSNENFVTKKYFKFGGQWGDNPADLILTTTGSLYYIDPWGENSTFIDTSAIGPISDILFADYDPRGNCNPYLFALTEGGISRRTIWVCDEESNKAYTNVNNSSSIETITSHTNSSITVSNQIFNRDISNDTTFNFVPTELASHTFTDQELCQAYLNAGFIQQQNNNS